jgi:hypothetical protein
MLDEEEQDPGPEEEEDEDGEGVRRGLVAARLDHGGRHEEDEGAGHRVAPVQPRVDRVDEVGPEEEEE